MPFFETFFVTSCLEPFFELFGTLFVIDNTV